MSQVTIIHKEDVGATLDTSSGKLEAAASMTTDAELAAQATTQATVDAAQDAALAAALTAQAATDAAQNQATIDAIAVQDAAEVDQERGYLMPCIMIFDQVEHSKLSLPIVADTDVTKSKWVRVPTNPARLTYPSTGKLIVVNFNYIVATRGGYPDYTSDTSFTHAQFCVAPTTSNSDEINANLAATGQTPPLAGSWSNTVDRAIAASVAAGGVHPYSDLWVRYVNLPARPGDAAQDVAQFGGSCPFSISSVCVYDSIDNGL